MNTTNSKYMYLIVAENVLIFKQKKTHNYLQLNITYLVTILRYRHTIVLLTVYYATKFRFYEIRIFACNISSVKESKYNIYK